MRTDDIRRELRQAAQRRAEAERARAEATDELVATIRRAQDAGMPITHIARELGISRQRIYKLLERR